MTRKKLSRNQREAACLLAIKRGDGSWLIPEPLRSSGTPEEIIQAVQYDHATPHALTADDRPQNLTPMCRNDHRRKTAVKDVPEIAKSKRIAKADAEFRSRLLAKQTDADDLLKKRPNRAKIPYRPFPKHDGPSQWPKRQFSGKAKGPRP